MSTDVAYDFEGANRRQTKVAKARSLIKTHNVELRHPSGRVERFRQDSVDHLVNQMIELLMTDLAWSVWASKTGAEAALVFEGTPKPEPEADIIDFVERKQEMVAEAVVEHDADKSEKEPDASSKDDEQDFGAGVRDPDEHPESDDEGDAEPEPESDDESDAEPDEESEGGPSAATLKTLRKAAKAEREALLKEFNDRYAVVNDGGSVVIFAERIDDVLERRVYDRMAPGALGILYANRWVCTSINNEGERKYHPAAKWWLTHEKRHQYIHGVIFDPSGASPRDGVLNLWRGFAYEPKPGSWDRLKEHIGENICRGNVDHYNYLMGWMARLVRFPAEPGEVAVVLKGGMGSGKGTLGHVLRRLFGQHGMHIATSKHLVGNFNGHLRDCVFLFADEAFFAGDKASLGVLKAIVTERVLTIEAKHVNAVQCANMLHIMMASNNEWVVPAALDERRFFVLDVSDGRKGDHDYFEAIHAEMNDGGYEAMLHELLIYELSRFNVRDVPKTSALQDQKKRSLDLKLSWWREVLMRGYVFRSKLGLEDDFGQWNGFESTEVLFESYLDYAKARAERHLMSREELGKFMRDMGCESKRPSGRVVVGERLDRASRMAELVYKDRAPGYRLGTLDAARKGFETATKLGVEWESEDEPE